MKSDCYPTRRTRKARKLYCCWRCAHWIQPGTLYHEDVDWPNWETNQSRRPVTYRSHIDCPEGIPAHDR